MGNTFDSGALTLGDADLYVSGVNLGSLKDSSFKFEREIKEHESGRPMMVDKRIVIRAKSQVAATIEELSLKNLTLAWGLNDTDLATINAGTTGVTDAPTKLTGTGWANLNHWQISSVAVRKVPGGAGATGQTTYVENTDYVVDYQDGRIRRIGSAITDGQQVYVTYSYATFDAKRFPMGKLRSLPELTNVELKHVYPDGSYMLIHYHKANITGNVELTFSKEDWIGLPITISPLSDPTNADAGPLGYMEFHDVA